MIFIKKHFISIFLASILIFIFVYGTKKSQERKMYLNGKNVLYAICEITDYITPARGTNSLVYFYYNGKKKIDSWSGFIYKIDKLKRDELKSFIGKKYFIKISVEKPHYTEIYLNKPVPDDFVYKKGQTWKNIPVSYD